MRDWDNYDNDPGYKKYKPSRQPRAYMQKNLREGRWHILTSPLTRDCRIWHNCEKYGNTQDLVKHQHIHEAHYWDSSTIAGNEIDIAWRCVECNLVAPEGIQGMYIMMDWDRATREVSENTQTAERWHYVDDNVPF